MELSFQNFVNIFQIITGLGTTGALIYAGLTFRRVRYSEQIRIAHEIQDELNPEMSTVLDPCLFANFTSLVVLSHFCMM
jgi:hypothetical protein